MRPHIVLLAFTVALTTAVSARQAPPATFRAEIEAVQVDAFVTDRDGRPVRNLQLDDFELLEDGKPQVITSFSEVHIPIDAPLPFSPAAPRADVATNAGGEGRLYIIALDEVGPDLAVRARHYLTTFIQRHFEPGDVGAIVNVGRASSSEAQDFTSDRGLLLAAIDRLKGWPADMASPPGFGPPVSAAVLKARSRAAALKALIGSLASISGRRKALIYITQEVGDVYGAIDYSGGVRSLEIEDLRAAMTDAMRGGVAIYALDACGLSPGGTLGETETNEGGACDADLDRMAAFRKMSEATGGFAVVNSNGFDRALERIVTENSSYYVLGFVSTNGARDGRYRRLEVRTTRPGLTVRARDGYIAPSRSQARTARTQTTATPSSSVLDIIATPVANAAVPMQVFAAAFKGAKGNDANVVITAHLDASRLGLAAVDGTMRGRLELAAAAISAAGKVTRSQPQVIQVALRPESYAQAAAHGLRLQSAIRLPPGRYQLRVAGGNTEAAKVGSVMYDLEVPDFRKGRLTLSAVAVSTTGADRPVTVLPAAANILPSVPTVSREFAAGTNVSLYVEVYDNAGRRPPGSIGLEVDVRDRQGRTVQSVGERRPRTTTNATEAFSIAVPLDVDVSDYVLHVEVTSGEDSVSRAIPIRVR